MDLICADLWSAFANAVAGEICQCVWLVYCYVKNIACYNCQVLDEAYLLRLHICLYSENKQCQTKCIFSLQAEAGQNTTCFCNRGRESSGNEWDLKFHPVQISPSDVGKRTLGRMHGAIISAAPLNGAGGVQTGKGSGRKVQSVTLTLPPIQLIKFH